MVRQMKAEGFTRFSVTAHNRTVAGAGRSESIVQDICDRLARSGYELGAVATREAIDLTIRALRAAGFAVRHKKTFNAGPKSPHIVTGYTVNSLHVSVSRHTRNAARIEVYDELIAERARGVNNDARE